MATAFPDAGDQHLEDDERENDPPVDPDVEMRVRKNEKSKYTRCVTKINAELSRENYNPTFLHAYRLELAHLYQDCVTQNARLLQSLKGDEQRCNTANEWQVNLSTQHAQLMSEIDDILGEDEPFNSTLNEVHDELYESIIQKNRSSQPQGLFSSMSGRGYSVPDFSRPFDAFASRMRTGQHLEAWDMFGAKPRIASSYYAPQLINVSNWTYQGGSIVPSRTDSTSTTFTHDPFASLPLSSNNVLTNSGAYTSISSTPAIATMMQQRRVSFSAPVTTVTSSTTTTSSNSSSYHNDPWSLYPRRRIVPQSPQPNSHAFMSGLPKIKVQKFDGNPRHFAMFMSSFKYLVHDVIPNDGVRLSMLRECLTENVQRTIADSLYDPTQYREALNRLNEEYGHPFLVAEAHIDSLMELPSLKSADSDGLYKFWSRLHEAVAGLCSSNSVYELSSKATVKILVKKLTPALRENWGLYVIDTLPSIPTVRHFDQWLGRIAKAPRFAMEKLSHETTSTKDHKGASSRNKFQPSKVNSVTLSPAETPSEPAESSSVENNNTSQTKPPISNYKCFVCGVTPPHSISKCPVYTKMSVDERWELMKREGRCFLCVLKKHYLSACESTYTCRVEGCGERHNTTLHRPKVNVKATRTTVQENSVLLSVVPIIIRAGNKSVITHALLDTGSEVSLIRKDIAEKLELQGPDKQLSFGTFNGNDPKITVSQVQFEVCSFDQSYVLPINKAFVVPKLNLSHRSVHNLQAACKWSHLSDLVLTSAEDADVTVLIGFDAPEAHVQLEVRRPPTQSAPMGILTHFGWTIVGTIGAPQSHPRVNPIRISSSDDNTDTLLERFWSIEEMGIQSSTPPLSREDKIAVNILESTIANIGNRYEVGLLWKPGAPNLPNNRQQALRRLFKLEARFRKDPEFAQRYSKVINEYLGLGHARAVEKEELDGSWSWYLPHHGVVSKSRPEKVRVVFDASAECESTSLNKQLLKGPDLLSSLIGVLMRFRQHLVPLSADIEKMYHQVRVRAQDQPALRFLWRDVGSSGPPHTYQMLVHVFGATSSPTTCLFALQKTALDNNESFPIASPLVFSRFYVDNYLDSFDSEDDAVKIISELKHLLKRGGLNLIKWMSSNRRVLATVPPNERAAPTVDLHRDNLPCEKTLGLSWCCESDSFYFTINVETEVITKRDILRQISTIFDPLGFLCPVVITAKILMQDLWRINLGWDDALPENVTSSWKNWAKSAQSLATFKVHRCIRTSATPHEFQLHVFTDASTKAYGAAAYARFVNQSGEVRVSFVIGKAKIAPIKQLSIPRLELQGAIVGLRLASTIQKEITLVIKRVVFWTDSETVLKWIGSKTYRFKAFVAHRIGEILTLSNADQWRHVPTDLNPADDCSRGLTFSPLTDDHRWLIGPAFLYTEEDAWPSRLRPATTVGDEEIKADSCIGAIAVTESIIMSLIKNSSSLFQVKFRLAVVRRFIFNLKNKPRRSGNIKPFELEEALIVCVMHTQMEAFTKEYAALKQRRPIAMSSSLLKLSPFIDEHGILRVGGRLERSTLPFTSKHPILLPKNDPLTTLVIRYYHRVTIHGQGESLLAYIRSRFWIINSRRAIRALVSKCVTCQRQKCITIPPSMAPLPSSRLQPLQPAFSNTGVDYFGPFTVTIGRRREKRWACLFTCFTTRAVHIEIAESLDTDAFMLCLRRFISRRGNPINIYSDNGTNFVSAERELKEGLNRLNQSKIGTELLQRGVKWIFSPPSGPHFGGTWERLVKPFKLGVKAAFGDRTVSEAVLQTTLVEIEGLLNARPLTNLSASPDDTEPLTPNHFLIGRPNPYVPTDVVSEDEPPSRQRYKISQLFLNQFWKRWLRYYVPDLIERKKWFTDNPSLKVDDFVFIKDPALSHGSWPAGRVIEVYPGPDGVVRVVKVKTARGDYVRPVIKLCKVDLSSEVKE